MSKRAAVFGALVVCVAGAFALAYAASGAASTVRAVAPVEPHLARAYPRAAAAAYGRRVLVLHARPLAAVEAEVLESARAGGGWELHPVAPAGARDFATALAIIAAATAREWNESAALSAATVDRLARAGIAIVVVDDGKQVLTPEEAAEVPGVSAEANVPALRVRAAEPVLRVAGEEPSGGGLRPRLEPARVRDLQDGLWGGSVTIEAQEPGTFVLSWPREGAQIETAAGATERDPLTELPLVTLDLPAGDTRVEVTYPGALVGRAAWAITGAAAVVASIIALLLALRPHPERDDEAGAAA